MNKKICLILTVVFMLSGIFQLTLLASDMSLYNNNTNLTRTAFTITDTGEAIVSLSYYGYPNVTTGATITVKIEKRSMLIFWTDIITETVTVQGENYVKELSYQLENTGTYRCTVEYVVSGTGGADDVLTFEDTKTYE